MTNECEDCGGPVAGSVDPQRDGNPIWLCARHLGEAEDFLQEVPAWRAVCAAVAAGLLAVAFVVLAIWGCA